MKNIDILKAKIQKMDAKQLSLTLYPDCDVLCPNTDLQAKKCDSMECLKNFREWLEKDYFDIDESEMNDGYPTSSENKEVDE